VPFSAQTIAVVVAGYFIVYAVRRFWLPSAKKNVTQLAGSSRVAAAGEVGK
jgi:hypothetical protein